MADVAEARLKSLGIELPPVPAPAANYVPTVRTGSLLFISGQVSIAPNAKFIGKLGLDVDVETGQKAARVCAINLLANMKAALGDAAHRGLLPATDIAWVVDLRARRTARAFARHHGGREGEEAMRVYQQAAIELGFLHHRYLRGTPPPDFALRGQDYVVRISAVRPSIAFPGQVVPTRMSAR